MREQIYYLWLARRYDVGSPMFKRLLEKFDTVQDIYDAEVGDYLRAGFSSSEVRTLAHKDLDEAKRLDEICYRQRIGIMVWGDPTYPSYLYDIENPPAVMYYRGYIPNLDDNVAVALVGTRSASDNGIKTAHRMAFDIASAGGIVISGFARGIDSAAHRGAIDAHGITMAFMGCGLDTVYPPENGALYAQIRERGTLLSEFAPGVPPVGTNFPVRNRLISAFARSVAVVEAPVGSGAMITAKYAVKQGKRLFSLPGSLLNPCCGGSNMLIRDGVDIALDAYDILGEYEFAFSHRIFLEKIGKQTYYSSEPQTQEQLPMPEVGADGKASAAFELPYAKSPESLVGDERTIYDIALRDRMITAEGMVREGISLDRAVLALMNLQLKNYIIALPGGLYSVMCKQEKE